MPRRVSYSVALFFWAVAVCRADLTLRYTIESKVSDTAPVPIAAQMKTQMAAQLPTEQLLKIKGTKTLSAIGAMKGIVDSTAGTITLLNPATRQYMKTSVPEYLAMLQSAVLMPVATQQAMQNMKFDVQSSDTGQTVTVAGIRATEHLMTVSLTMNVPSAAVPSLPVIRVDIRTWLANPDDLGQIPGLRQYADSIRNRDARVQSRRYDAGRSWQNPRLGRET